MSLDVQSDVNAQTRVVEIETEDNALGERVENGLVVLVSGLVAVLISALWVSLSLG
jgi:hypothetical protein